MATLSQFRQSITSQDLQEKFEASCMVSAAYVTAEDPGTTDHAARLAWANNVIFDAAFTTTTARKILRWGLATNATLQENGPAVLDSVIDIIVASALGDAVVLGMVD